MGKYLVTAATGAQGSAVVRQLEKAGHEVRCLVRDPDSAKARALSGNGVVLVKGDFASNDALAGALRGCDGVFLSTQPGSDEAEQARNVIEAAKKEGVQIIVAATVTRAEEHQEFAKPTDTFVSYWHGKAAVQRLVAESGIPSWTILQPAWIMTNFIAPNAAMYWPELKEQGVLLGSLDPRTKMQLIDPSDMGTFAAAALTDADRAKWHQKIVRMAGDEKTLDEIAQTISGISGKSVVAKFRSLEEIDELASQSPFVWSQRWQRDSGTQVDISSLRQFNLPLTSFHDFLQWNEAALKDAV